MSAINKIDAEFMHGKIAPENRQPNELVAMDLMPNGIHRYIFPVPQAEKEKVPVHVTFLSRFFDEPRRKVRRAANDAEWPRSI